MQGKPNMDLKEAIFLDTETKPLMEPADAFGWKHAGSVFVREMNAEDSDAYEASRVRIRTGANGQPIGEPATENIRARLLVKCLCDVEGKRIFTDAEAAILGQKLPRRIAKRLFDQAQRLNGLDAKEGVEKNASPPATASPTGSPSPLVNGTLSACAAG
jgi:hypothetical protein